MAVAFVQTQAGVWDAASTSITAGSGSNRALFACAAWSGTGSVSGVSSSVDGAFTLVTGSLNTIVGGRTQGVVWYVLKNPTTGAHTITSSNTGTVNTKQVSVTEVTGVDQTTPYGTPVLVDSTAASLDHVITGTVVGDLAISGCNNGDTANLGQTAITVGDQRWEVLETAFWGTTSLGGTRDGAAGSTTITYNPLRTEGTALSGFAIKAAALFLTLYLNNPVQGGSLAGLLDVTAPTASTSTTGWTVGTNSAVYSRMTYNAEIPTGNFTATVQPSGVPVNSGEDCYRLSAVTTGQFSAGTWYSSISALAVSSGGIQDGRARFRLYRSANADLTSATLLTQGTMVGSLVTGLATNVAQSSSASTFIAASNLTNEFLIMQIAWEAL
jgi:hypothetical protein